MGVTKERIRQIEARALSKLRRAAEEDRIESTGITPLWGFTHTSMGQ